MKNTLIKSFNKYLFLLFASFLLVVQLNAQTDSTTEKVEEVVEAPSLIAPSLELIIVQKGDRSIDCKVKMQAKVKGTFYKLPLLKVSINLVTPTETKQLGFAITDRNGKVTFNVKGDLVVPDAEGKVTLKALYAGSKQTDPAEAEVSFKRGLLVITPVVVDSTYSVQAKLIDISTGVETPVPEAAIGLFVKRTFNPLKIGEGTTDANGEISIEVPKQLPGDANKNITLIVKLDENELYGNLEASVIKAWGTSVSDANVRAPRALWSSRPPLWMIITFSLLMTIVWGHYIVIIYELIRLRKEEPHTAIIS
ncbi:MAG: hypothetical protein Q8K64_06950 [Sediminibacterium sp.]|nr:MAG: hypothetical protein FD183_401 [Chitinophagaceae bacterium]MDP1843144.1 hypothetical protein [Sediminibacterium sp.]TXT34620.1 MAG: hypothetical protein FD136_209 [Chitinophagaceae bacterium]